MERCADYGGKRRKTGLPCRKPAGWGVKDTSTGKCRIHGGGNEGRPIIHGRYSIKHKQDLQERMQEFLADPNPGSLMDELALQRAMLQDFIERLYDDIKVDVTMRKHVFDMVDSISKVVERISRIINQTALTQADIQLLQAVLPDLLLRYIDDPEKRLAFMVELRQTIGSSYQTSRSQVALAVSS